MHFKGQLNGSRPFQLHPGVGPGVKTRMCPPYPERVVKGD